MSEDELRREADAVLARARAEAAARGDKKLMAALAAIGSWSDLDWDETWEETAAALDRIRHANVPTPPIDDLP